MKILVIGASGLVGSHVLRVGRASGHEMIGTYRNSPAPGLIRCDCADLPGVEALLVAQRPDAVVHTAGWTWVDGCEDDPQRALAENSHLPAAIAGFCSKSGIHFTSFSTSYVFDGRNGPYAEDAQPNPINAYGRSKLDGEQRVLQVSGGKALIPRLICVYGAEAQKKNFACQVHKAMLEGKAMLLPSDQEGNPTYAGDVARWLLALLEKRESGVWHLGGPWPECKRPDWAEKLVSAFVAEGVEPHSNFTIKSVPTAELKQRALRPLKAGMVSIKSAALNFQPTPFNQTIQEMLRAGL